MMELNKMLMEKIESINSNQTMRSEISRIQSHLEVVGREISCSESLLHNCSVKMHSENSR